MGKTILAFFFYCAAALVQTYPLLCHLSSSIPSDLGDTLLNTWILAWEHHALFTEPTALFHGNIFYPSPYTIALSEHMLANLPLFAPVYAATGNPVLAYNGVFFFSFVLSGLGVFLLVHYWTREFWAALVAGFLFGFAPVRFYQISHLQLLNFFWAPLALLFLDRFLRGQRGSVAGFTLFFCLQFLVSGYLGYFTAIAAGVYIVSFGGLRRDLINRGVMVSLGISATVSLLILLPFHLPYFWVRSEWGLHRSLGECVFYSADFPLSYLAPADYIGHVYQSLLAFALDGLGDRGERQLFPGFVLPFLTGLGIFYSSRSGIRSRVREMKVLFGGLCAVAFLLSLGPFLTVWGRNTRLPLPYLGLYYLLPGFDSMRVPARFAHLVVLAASVLAGLGVVRLTELFSRWLGWFAKGWRFFLGPTVSLVVIGLYTLESGLQPLPLPEVPTGQDVPPVYRWLAERKHEGPILEVPFEGEEWHDFKYMYFSTYHWRPLVNGFSGFEPPTYFHIVKFIDDLPSSRAVAYLSALGVTTIVVHTDLLSAEEQERWDNPALAEAGLKKIQQFGPDIVYRVTARPPVSDRLEIRFTPPPWVPREDTITLGLVASGLGGRAWVHPQPFKSQPVLVRWEELETGKAFSESKSIPFPLVLSSGEGARFGVTIHSPAQVGRYLVTASLPDLGVGTFPQPVDVLDNRAPTSQNSPQLLGASYTMEGWPGKLLPAHPVRLSLTVVNTGQAIWLARAREDRGAVRLSWRWMGKDQAASFDPREPLTYDVFPGQEHRFTLTVVPPAAPGDYLLEFDLVSERVAWFQDVGVKPLRVPARVVGSVGSGPA